MLQCSTSFASLYTRMERSSNWDVLSDSIFHDKGILRDLNREGCET